MQTGGLVGSLLFIREFQDVGLPSQSFVSSLSGGDAMGDRSRVLQQLEGSQGKGPFLAPQFLSSANSDSGPKKPDPCFYRNWVARGEEKQSTRLGSMEPCFGLPLYFPSTCLCFVPVWGPGLWIHYNRNDYKTHQ